MKVLGIWNFIVSFPAVCCTFSKRQPNLPRFLFPCHCNHGLFPIYCTALVPTIRIPDFKAIWLNPVLSPQGAILKMSPHKANIGITCRTCKCNSAMFQRHIPPFWQIINKRGLPPVITVKLQCNTIGPIPVFLHFMYRRLALKFRCKGWNGSFLHGSINLFKKLFQCSSCQYRKHRIFQVLD